MKPQISIICPSFNHELFVTDFINSVLNQTFKNFELIIIDDCSFDKNLEKIKSFNDNRIKIIEHEFNKGINASLNEGFKIMQSNYAVFIASDDMLEPKYLQKTIEAFENNPNIGVIYHTLQIIDENNKKGQINTPKIKDRIKAFKEMFFYKNVFGSPGMAIRKTALKDILPLDTSILQYQDYQLNAGLLINNNLLIIKEPLVNYRWCSNNKNASARTVDVKTRESLEENAFMDIFLNIKTAEKLEELFSEELKQIGEPTDNTIPYFLGRLALQSKLSARKIWGYQTIMKYIANTQNLRLLNELYGFDFSTFISLVKEVNIFNSKAELTAQKYKKLFNILLIISIVLLILLICTVSPINFL